MSDSLTVDHPVEDFTYHIQMPEGTPGESGALTALRLLEQAREHHEAGNPEAARLAFQEAQELVDRDLLLHDIFSSRMAACWFWFLNDGSLLRYSNFSRVFDLETGPGTVQRLLDRFRQWQKGLAETAG